MPTIKTGQPQDGVPVTARKTQEGPPGAPKKDQGPDHGKGPKDEPNNGRRADPGPKLLEDVGGNQRSQDKADDLRPHVLDHRRPVQSEGARDVPLEAGHADPHVAGIAPFLKERGKDSDKCPNRDNAPSCGKDVSQLPHVATPFSQLLLPRNTHSPLHGTGPDLRLVSKQSLAIKQRLDEALLLRQIRLIKQEIPIINEGLIG